jgi:DNA-binding GntR family transcriptional regulator
MSAAAFFDAARALKREATENAGAGLTDAEVAALNAVISALEARHSVNQPHGPHGCR